MTAERLACEYPYLSGEQLHADGRAWLGRITALLDRHLTLAQHREILTQAGWVALVAVSSTTWASARSQRPPDARPLSLGEESGNADVVGWAHEMRSWYALTQGNYRGAIVASQAGEQVAPSRGAAVQLLAQRAKAWARIGDRRQVEVALDAGRRLLEQLPYPTNLDNHFVVDPAKYDFYAMDCYRVVGENGLADAAAQEVIASSIDFDGTVRKPMRVAEAEITLGVLAARRGELEQAVDFGRRVLGRERRSLPSLRMASSELAHVVSVRFGQDRLAVGTSTSCGPPRSPERLRTTGPQCSVRDALLRVQDGARRPVG